MSEQPRVSIISLIYCSPRLADWVFDSVMKFTPMLGAGEAEFFFVANDPTPLVLSHLRDKGYPFITNANTPHTDQELLGLGYAWPEYISRVYRGYNAGIWHARGDYVALVNSDNYFSPDWLENLLKYADRSKVVSSLLVERQHPRFGVFPGAVRGEFGGTPATFDEPGFLQFAQKLRLTGLKAGGAYMPALYPRDVAIEAGLFPTGNVAGRDFDEVAKFGDEAFIDRLGQLGVAHYTALDSVVYHLKEGEREDAESYGEADLRPASADGLVLNDVVPYPPPCAIPSIPDRMLPTSRHDEIISGLLHGEAAPPSLERQTRAVRQWLESRLGERRAIRVISVVRRFGWLVRPARRVLLAVQMRLSR